MRNFYLSCTYISPLVAQAIFLAKERAMDGLWKGRGTHVHKGNEYILRGSTCARRQEGMVASPLQGFSTAYQASLMDGEKVKGRVDVEGRMEEIMDEIPDSDAQKSESSCFTRQSKGVKMEERGSEIEYCLHASKCPGGLIIKLQLFLRTGLNCTK